MAQLRGRVERERRGQRIDPQQPRQAWPVPLREADAEEDHRDGQQRGEYRPPDRAVHALQR